MPKNKEKSAARKQADQDEKLAVLQVLGHAASHWTRQDANVAYSVEAKMLRTISQF
jgi:hypothetical protein